VIPNRASFCAAKPPALLSLIPPVSGDLAPAESRPLFAAGDPDRMPGAKINLFAFPSAWQVAGTSSNTILDVSARPPRPAYASGTSSKPNVFSLVFTLKSFPIFFSLARVKNNYRLFICCLLLPDTILFLIQFKMVPHDQQTLLSIHRKCTIKLCHGYFIKSSRNQKKIVFKSR